MTISKEQRRHWENVWKILRSLDAYELQDAGATVELGFNWPAFRHDPHGYLIRTDNRQSGAIWKAVEKRMPKALSRTKVGVRVACFTCRLTKKPVGRDAPMAAANSYCDYECPGYWDGPRVGSLWPGESEYVFGFAVGDVGTEEFTEISKAEGRG